MNNMTAIEKSSLLIGYGYDPDKKELTIGFKTGGTYLFRGVPQGVIDDFLEAPSMGSFFLKQIKPHYPGEKLSE